MQSTNCTVYKNDLAAKDIQQNTNLPPSPNDYVAGQHGASRNRTVYTGPLGDLLSILAMLARDMARGKLIRWFGYIAKAAKEVSSPTNSESSLLDELINTGPVKSV